MQGLDELIARLDAAVEEPTPQAITARVKKDLEEILGTSRLELPDRFRVTRADCYARRLLYQDPRLRYTAVVMTWGPGQGTPVHDHGGLWCVEGVVEGLIAVTRYAVTPQPGDRYQVRTLDTLLAGTGEAGRLIPPTDHHVIANALSDRPSLTLHVYGGELDGCQVFVPEADGLFTSRMKALSYPD